MATDVCASCQDPLVFEVDSDSELEDFTNKKPSACDSIPDDVELSCGCHFHWECFLEAYTITECPSCAKGISSLSSDHKQQVLCTVRNEGGVQTGFDILPSATEEAYLRTYPEERRGHAFLEFCREGDLDAIVHMVKDTEAEDAEDDTDDLDILRYCGSFEGIQGSGLHVAITYNQVEVAWLLLILGSSLDWSQFPPDVLRAMDGFLSKSARRAVPDIRSVTDAEGRTPLALAEKVGGVWADWLRAGHLDIM